MSILLPLPSSGTTYLETLREQTPILPNEEIRAAWVVRFALTSKDEIDRAIDYAVRARFQLLFVQVRARGDAYYRSSLEPEAPDLQKPVAIFDPFSYFLKRAHEADIAIHAWVNVCYVWSNPERRPPPEHLIERHPDWLMADAEGTRMDAVSVDEWKRRGLEGYYVSPGNAAVRQHTVDVIKDIATRYPIDGVHLDYIRYPGLGFDFSENQRAEFELRYGIDPLAAQRDPDTVSSLLGDGAFDMIDSLRIEWRIEQVDSLVHSISQAIGELPLSAAVVPDYNRARFEKGQDWVRWVVRGDVDFVVPMAYTYEPADLNDLVKLIKRTIGSERFLVGLPVYDGRSQYLGYSVSLLRQQDILGYSLFSYNALAEDQFTLEFLERVFLKGFEPVDESEPPTDEGSGSER
jgi:uncharacterized lipoprotein YddW (UPF0748 family)